MAIGIRAHDLIVENDTPEALAAAAAAHGFEAVQLAMGKSFGVGIDAGTLSPGIMNRIGQAFSRKNVRISVLACYGNIIHPDLTARSAALKRFNEHIRFCHDIGCSVVATETGNVNSEIKYTKDNFTAKAFRSAVDSVKILVEEAEKFGIIVGIEPGVNHPIYSLETMAKLIDDVQSNCLQVVLDPVNLLTFENHEKQSVIFKDVFNCWGDRIVAIHAKDFTIENNTLASAAIGKGKLDYDLIMSMLANNKPEIDIILDEVHANDIASSLNFIKEKTSFHNNRIWPA